MLSERLAREQYFSPNMIAEGGEGWERTQGRNREEPYVQVGCLTELLEAAGTWID